MQAAGTIPSGGLDLQELAGVFERSGPFATVYLGDSFVHGRSAAIVGIGVAVTALSVLALYLLRRSNAYIYMSSPRVTS